MLGRKLGDWYIPLKQGHALFFKRSQAGCCWIRQIHTSPATPRCRATQEGSSSPDKNDGSQMSDGDKRRQAKTEKMMRRRDRMNVLRQKEEEEGGEKGGVDGGVRRRRMISSPRDGWRKKDVITYDLGTLPGEKKDVTVPLPASYSPRYVEACWYDWWEKMGFFKPENQRGSRTDANQESPPFVMCLPPPNVTGVLHLGHTLTATIQDSLVRWHRMNGDPTLWIPGCDHAGIATQIVVEKHLQHVKGITRQDVGREEFVKHVWKWKEEKGDEIYRQLRRLGASLDWDRASFTMDEKFSRAVREAFVRLHGSGLIYRSSQLINWSCTLKSAISDIEVDQISLSGRTSLSVPGYKAPVEFGTLTYFAYPVEGSAAEIPVATTRLETMLGDTAVAVHPRDNRFKHLIGHCVVHPFGGRRLPIVADERVDVDYGTGAVKLTPAHDYNDYEMGKHHHLEVLSVIDENGHMTDSCQEFKGMKRFDARNAVLQALKDRGLYRDTKENPMNIPVCSRSGDVVEPLLKSQWFVRCTEMGQEALRAVETGDLEIIPPMYTKTWRQWLSNVRDWCISRQLWWGHRIPAYYVKVDGKEPPPREDENSYWVSGQTEEAALKKTVQRFGVDQNRLSLSQDEDVLDTWFSSALFPFAVHGWPDQTADLKGFYPSTALETGYDILFFWVARMVMMGQQLTGQLPFTKVYLHSMVRDAHGRKMSKSLGNVIDPLDVMQGISLEQLQARLLEGNMKLDSKELEVAMKGQRSDYPQGIPECGTDALRFALASFNSQGQDINLNVGQVLEYRHFCNKIWNAMRFTLGVLGSEFCPMPLSKVISDASPMDKWILSKLAAAIQACHDGFTKVDLPSVTGALYKFWLHQLCDVYLECIKQPLSNPKSPEATPTANTLYAVVEGALRLLSPIMPYLTEELYQRLPRRPGEDWPSICVSPYPTCEEEFPARDESIESMVDQMLDVVRTVRSLEAMLGLKRGEAPVGISCQDEEMLSTLEKLRSPLTTLVRSSHLDIQLGELPPSGSASLSVGTRCNVHLHLQGSTSAATVERLETRCTKAESLLTKLRSAMSSPGYEDKVPKRIQDMNRTKVEQLEADITSLRVLLTSLKESES